MIPLLVELLVLKAGPCPVNFAAANAATQCEHHIGVTVIGAARAVFARGAAELAHGDEADVRHSVSQVLIERGDCIAELAEQIRQLPLGRPRADFVDVRIPTAHLRERHFQADV